MLQPSIRREIGTRLRDARLHAGLTQEDVSADFQCTRQAVSSWERGSTMPSVLELRELATLYVVSADQLLFGVDDLASSRDGVLNLFKVTARKEPRGEFADSEM